MARRGAPSWQAWQTGDVYTLHLWPPYGPQGAKQQAGHYTGWAHEGRLAHRLTDHAMGRGAKLTRYQIESGGSWVVADVERGVTRDREHQLKYRGATQRCTVCKTERDYTAGKLTAAEALTAAGWDKANEHQRGLLLDILGLDAPPPEVDVRPAPPPEPEVRVSVPSPRPVPTAEQRAEMDAQADALIAQWTTPKAEKEVEYEFW